MPGKFFFSLVILLCCTEVVYSAPPPSKMRPYSGIGVLTLRIDDSDMKQKEPFYIYEEPGIFRRGELSGNAVAGSEAFFGEQKSRIRLIATARKGSWFKVCYDDAGREAWIDSQRQVTFQSWEQFFKGHVGYLLPGLKKPHYQLYRQPERSPVTALVPKQPFKILRLENDWIMVMVDQNSIGWLRWRDEDGRLLVGADSDLKQ